MNYYKNLLFRQLVNLAKFMRIFFVLLLYDNFRQLQINISVLLVRLIGLVGQGGSEITAGIKLIRTSCST